MSSVNKAIIVGRLTRDPEVRRTNAGDAVVSFSVATSESWRDKATGDRKERAEFHNVVIFNDALCKVAEAYARKGSKVYIEGQLQTREYTDKDGNQRKTTEVVLQRFRGELTLLDTRKGDDGDVREPARKAGSARASDRGGGYAPIDDGVPFAPEWR